MTAPAALALPGSVDAVIALLATEQYLCDRQLATAIFLALKLQRPLFLEGEPGVGKTELAKVLARIAGCREGPPRPRASRTARTHPRPFRSRAAG